MIAEIAKNIYWVGVVDWNVRHFHGHELSLSHGTTYNAYLIVDREIVLVDTVMRHFEDQLLENIRQVVDPGKISTIIANHSELDHSGALPAVLRQAPNAEVVVSRRGKDSFPGHFRCEWLLLCRVNQYPHYFHCHHRYKYHQQQQQYPPRYSNR